MSLIPCCDLHADNKPCRCAFEAQPYRAERRFSINGQAQVEEGAIVRVHPNGAVFLPGQGPLRLPQIHMAMTAGWLVPAEEAPLDAK